uniref:Uncharacterized protein n=1 Tax=Aegilops tauschii subsp. strangulata TaxID=200361 RepID=A0A453HQ87_AEGTS
RSSAPAASGKGNHEKDAPVTHSRAAGRRFLRLPPPRRKISNVRFLLLFLLASSRIIRPRPFSIFPAARFHSIPWNETHRHSFIHQGFSSFLPPLHG